MQPDIKANQVMPELTFRTILLGLLLALLLAASNTFLALKIGVLTASSIPAAILSMSLLRFFKNSSILENNLVQTCASSGEAIAGGIVFTAPALIIVHAWYHFPYIETFALAAIGGLLGVVFTIPLRRIYMTNPDLRFPEAQAIAEVLQAGAHKMQGSKTLVTASIIGAFLECAQTGLKLIAGQWQFWITKGTTTVGFGTGFSGTLLGAGYLMGFRTGVSILIGAIAGHAIGVPAASVWMQHPALNAPGIAHYVTDSYLRYMGISAMLAASLIILLQLSKPFAQSLMVALQAMYGGNRDGLLPRTEHDLPLMLIGVTLLTLLTASIFLFLGTFHLHALGLSTLSSTLFIALCVLYLLCFGFIFSAICGYFSGLVGVAASPGSAVAIASVLISMGMSSAFFQFQLHLSMQQWHQVAVISLITASLVMGSACVANNNAQDLKVGHIIGATPWKQQVMLALGCLASALLIPIVMQLLFNAYGIATVVPPGVNPNTTLAAPPAAAMAAIAQSLLEHSLPLSMMLTGAALMLVGWLINHLVPKRYHLQLIAIAIGIYLPLASSTPLFLGGAAKWLSDRNARKCKLEQGDTLGTVRACGLVAGAAITNVLLAIPFALLHNPDILSLVSTQYRWASELAGVASTLLVMFFFEQT